VTLPLLQGTTATVPNCPVEAIFFDALTFAHPAAAVNGGVPLTEGDMDCWRAMRRQYITPSAGGLAVEN